MTTRTLIIIAAVVLAVGLAIYLHQGWPLKALAWAEHFAPMIAESKVVAKVAIVLGSVSGMVWAGVTARRK